MLLPSRSCKSIGCAGIAERDGFCLNCRADGKGKDFRPSARERGYDDSWRQYSRLFLSRNPWCRDPFKRHPDVVRAADVVDHIKPHRGDKVLFWSETNHQSLCTNCHNFKTATYDGGFGRERKEFRDVSNKNS